jgi:hypothetical protein
MAGVDPWGKDRDATRYQGPYPVIAHPSCAAWGRFYYRARERERHHAVKALELVRRFGGVLEHPSASRLWQQFRLPPPVIVDQCWWGHKCRKRTWLYFVGCAPAPLPVIRLEPTHCIESSAVIHLPVIHRSERHLTPLAFALWLKASVEGNY